eukprot:11594573-Alexandrium_andersonii.AAC.1
MSASLVGSEMCIRDRDIADFRAAEEPPASAMPERSDGRRSGPGGQPYRDDITGAVLGSELVAAARSEEI